VEQSMFVLIEQLWNKLEWFLNKLEQLWNEWNSQERIYFVPPRAGTGLIILGSSLYRALPIGLEPRSSFVIKHFGPDEPKRLSLGWAIRIE